MINDKRICIFTFRNGTQLHAAIPWLDGTRERGFDEMKNAAEALCWRGDENHGRGGLKSFEVGDVITA
jgi:hypothetical protein